MKLSEYRIGIIVEIIDRSREHLYNDPLPDKHYVGHIIGLADNMFQIIPKLMMASGDLREIHYDSIRPYCD